MTRKMIATVKEDGYGYALLFVDNGSTIHQRRISKAEAAELLPELVADGFALRDPDHVLDVWGILSEHRVSQNAASADAAGSRGRGYVGAWRRRQDAEAMADTELSAFPEW